MINKENKSQIAVQLKNFGLSDKETSLYLAVIANGPTTATNLARASGLKRPTVYVLIEDLISKGLLAQEKQKGKQFIKVAPLDKFRDLIEEEAMKIEQQRRSMDGLLRELAAFREAGREPAYSSYHEGEGGIFDIFQKILASEEQPHFFGSVNSLLKKYSDEKWTKIFTQLKKGGEKSKIITDKNTKFENTLSAENINNDQLQILPPEFDAKAVAIVFGNRIALIALSYYPFGVIIENKEISALLKFLFTNLWKKPN